MCQSMDIDGVHTLTREEMKLQRKYVNDLKEVLERHLEDGEWEYWTEEELRSRIAREEKILEDGSYSYTEDVELRCCGQG